VHVYSALNAGRVSALISSVSWQWIPRRNSIRYKWAQKKKQL